MTQRRFKLTAILLPLLVLGAVLASSAPALAADASPTTDSSFRVSPDLHEILSIPIDGRKLQITLILFQLAAILVAAKLLGALAEGLSPWFADAKLQVDFDRVPALAEDRERLWAQVSAADFLDPAEKRAMLGLPDKVERNKS